MAWGKVRSLETMTLTSTRHWLQCQTDLFSIFLEEDTIFTFCLYCNHDLWESLRSIWFPTELGMNISLRTHISCVYLHKCTGHIQIKFWLAEWSTSPGPTLYWGGIGNWQLPAVGKIIQSFPIISLSLTFSNSSSSLNMNKENSFLQSWLPSFLSPSFCWTQFFIVIIYSKL